MINGLISTVPPPAPTGYWLTDLLNPESPVLKSETSSFDVIQHMTEQFIKGENGGNVTSGMPDGYMPWGNNDFAQILCTILETNPFFAASLTSKTADETDESWHEGFDVTLYDPESAAKTFPVEIMETWGMPGQRVNFHLTVKDTGGLEISSYDVYEFGSPDAVTPTDKGSPDATLQYYSTIALFHLFFVSEVLHSTLHVFHNALTNAFLYSARNSSDEALRYWAGQCNANVNMKNERGTTGSFAKIPFF